MSRGLANVWEGDEKKKKNLDVMNTGATVSRALPYRNAYTAQGSLHPARRSAQPMISSKHASVMMTANGVVVVCFCCVCGLRDATAALATRQAEEMGTKTALAARLGL